MHLDVTQDDERKTSVHAVVHTRPHRIRPTTIAMDARDVDALGLKPTNHPSKHREKSKHISVRHTLSKILAC